MINIKNKCTECDHHKTCKYSEDYIAVDDIISEIPNEFSYDILTENIAQIELTCKYFKPVASTPKSSLNDLR